ncbi:DUF1772 domain-containing protein [Vannielia litorea]|uniref:anthrone oxygenase family protein n=1 Tax=Vannielia litorea TaxID=1217970 RepID=UPI001C97555B|nr:anthrone oxygenase family protein [Vannielia litorea]MBY6049255.1 DUF1772 domain-containing protein [Vannielia litorea]MBY6076669.1 DUF1772 domain-containing protein [Vannielia litorea]
MTLAFRFSALVALLLNGALFGFFYAWVCSTMWGLDAAAPEVAIRAMQAMNASVRNAVFAPAFFATGPLLLVTAVLAWKSGQSGKVSGLLVLAGGVVLLGGTVLTMVVNVPMNEALALVTEAQIEAGPAAIWADYSAPWQVWNQTRTALTGLGLVLAGAALLAARPTGA